MLMGAQVYIEMYEQGKLVLERVSFADALPVPMCSKSTIGSMLELDADLRI
jgi:hypothetical protein